MLRCKQILFLTNYFMSETQIQNKISELKDLSIWWLNTDGPFNDFEKAKNILEIIKNEKTSQNQLKEIIKFLEEQKMQSIWSPVKFHELNRYKEDFEKLLANYGEEKKEIINKASADTKDVKSQNNQVGEFIVDWYDNKKAIKRYSTRLSKIIAKFDEKDTDEAKLKELLEKTISNPSKENIIALQDFMKDSWEILKISKDGNSDGKFGQRTIAGLEKIVWIEIPKVAVSGTWKKGGNKTERKRESVPVNSPANWGEKQAEVNKWVPELKKQKSEINKQTWDYRNILLDEKTIEFINKWDTETILKELSRDNLDKRSWLYKLRTQLEKNNISPRDYIESIKEQKAIISVEKTNIKMKDWSLLSGKFLQNWLNMQLIDWTRKYTDWRVMIYKDWKEVDYTMKYMVLMVIMAWIDLAWFTWIWTVPSLIAGTWYDIYDLTQKEDAWWQLLKKWWFVDSRFYAWDKWIMEYTLNALWLIPGMTAATKLYKINKFKNWLSAAEKAEFSRLESFMKDKFWLFWNWIWETAAKKWKIWIEYSKEANDLRKAREKEVKKIAKEKKASTKNQKTETHATFSETKKVLLEETEKLGKSRASSPNWLPTWEYAIYASRYEKLYKDLDTKWITDLAKRWEEIAKLDRNIAKNHLKTKWAETHIDEESEALKNWIKPIKDKFSAINNEISIALEKLKVWESFEVWRTKISKVETAWKEYFEIAGDSRQFSKLEDIMKLLKEEDKNKLLLAKTTEKLLQIKKPINFKNWDDIFEISKDSIVKTSKDWSRIKLSEAEKNEFINKNFDELFKITHSFKFSEWLSKYYDKIKDVKVWELIPEKLKNSLIWKKTKNWINWSIELSKKIWSFWLNNVITWKAWNMWTWRGPWWLLWWGTENLWVKWLVMSSWYAWYEYFTDEEYNNFVKEHPVLAWLEVWWRAAELAYIWLIRTLLLNEIIAPRLDNLQSKYTGIKFMWENKNPWKENETPTKTETEQVPFQTETASKQEETSSTNTETEVKTHESSEWNETQKTSSSEETNITTTTPVQE